MVKQRTLQKNVPGGYFLSTGVAGAAPTTIPNGWEYTEGQSPSGAYNYGILYYIGTFDLEGQFVQGETVFPSAFLMTDIGGLGVGATNTPNIEVANMLMMQNPRVGDLNNVGEFTWNLPGSSLSRFMPAQVLSGQWSRYTYNSAYNNLVRTDSSAWGTGEGTNARKMYFVRAFKFLLLGTSIDFEIPPSVAVSPVLLTEEETLQYITRLDKSTTPQGDLA